MRRTLAALTAFALLLTLVAWPARGDDQKSENTKSYSGFLSPTNWQGLMEHWKIHGDTVIGTTPAPTGIAFNTFLCSKKTYRDFEMSFQIRLKGGVGNSGVQIRSKLIDPAKFVVSGPQCDVGQQYWGSLYGERFGGMMQASPPEKVKAAVKPDQFNDYHIRCMGKHVTIAINGTTMVDQDFAKLPDEGIIAYQLHQGFVMEVTFKNIKFRELK